MLKALIRTIILIVVILVAVQLFPVLAPYQTAAIIVALITGFFSFIARSIFFILIIAAVAAVYFHFL